MPHALTVTTPPYEISNSDLEVKVDKDDSKLGTIKISRGSVEWTPSGNTYGHHLTWTEFHELMIKEGKKR